MYWEALARGQAKNRVVRKMCYGENEERNTSKDKNLEDIMQLAYSRFITMHKAVVHLYIFQQQCMQITQNLKDINTVIVQIKEWKMR